MAKRGAPQGWHREDIKGELRKRFGPITVLSRAWGYGPAAITSTLLRPDFSPAIEQRIADALELTPHTLWPERWLPNGTPRPRSTNTTHPSVAIPQPHRQKSEAA
ncbi:MAG: helix-turn-helix domain-containing protein [Roseomonas sp.]|nr:helix-turn-helix domain-containing protein [Roseomonas sp.]